MARYALCLLLLLLPAAAARAQTDSLTVRITEVDTSQFPVITAKIRVYRAGTQLLRLDAANFSLYENGIPQVIDAIDCPPDTGKRFSVALLLDRSGSMSGTKLASAKSAARIFLDFLDPRDEAAVFSFSSGSTTYFTVNQDFTSDIPLLKRSLDPLIANGGTWIWRSMQRSLDTLNYRRGRRILIALTDGRSSGEGLYASTGVIKKADSLKIPIYTIGLGGDVLVSELTSVASATGGKFYNSPTEAQLEAAFRKLAADVITDGCVLRYTTRDICRDGSTRRLELIARDGGLAASDTAAFRIPLGLTEYAVALGAPAEAEGRESFHVPVLLRQSLGLKPLDFTFTFTWPAALLQFDSVATAGTIAEGAALRVDATQAGSVTVAAQGAAPARTAGALFELVFTARGGTAEDTAGIAVAAQALTQGCPTTVTAEGASIALHPCASSYRVGSAGTLVVPAGGLLRVPVELEPAPDAGLQWSMNLGVRYDPAVLDFEGVDTARGLAARAGVAVAHADGRLSLAMRGTAPGDRGLLVELLFRARPARQPNGTTVEIECSDLRAECAATVENRSPLVVVDGSCVGVVARAAGQHLAVSPNPARGSAELRFTVADEGPAVIDILDEGGRVAARVLDGTVARGGHRLTVATGALPAGRYLVALTTAAGRSARPLVILR